MRRAIRSKVGLAVLLGSLVLSACGAQPSGNDQGRPVMVVQPELAEAGASVFPGEVRARHEVALAFRVGGEVVRRVAEVGDAVEEGQVLAELDPSDTGLQVDAARARLASAEADRVVARAERDRFASLAERQLVSRSILDNAENALAGAQARLDQARADLEVSRNQSGYTTLRAPVPASWPSGRSRPARWWRQDSLYTCWRWTESAKWSSRCPNSGARPSSQAGR
ncbi:efflux RND transporter periplasmic adaptor subunit [Alkalisalibacterium limincola]|uniref:efflux RND transporter periplasmic adaptor subunit n=1 Tax=Alkalisalibacterium limincola TaxID=2699169 RepID=UPI002106114B|nr:biotin/lipoyl-binding protein [Alkalisalibacterium limincola]